jgi:hypothetical protein
LTAYRLFHKPACPAAVFQPARRRVRELVDRRFNRRRYDAARTIQAFSVRLREQVDLDTLTTELLAVVNQTMEPTSAWLWLRPPQWVDLHPGLPSVPAEQDSRTPIQPNFREGLPQATGFVAATQIRRTG